MATKKITKKEVLDIVRELPEQKKNPYSSKLAQCLYTDPRNKQRHCVVGQVLTELELPLPKADDPGWGVMRHRSEFKYRFTPAAHRFLSDLQSLADGTHETDYRPRKWGWVKSQLGLAKA